MIRMICIVGLITILTDQLYSIVKRFRRSDKMTKAIRRDRIFIFLIPIVVAIVSFFILKGTINKYNIEVNTVDGLDDCKLMLDICEHYLDFSLQQFHYF